MIAILFFLGKMLDLFVTQIALKRGFVEKNVFFQNTLLTDYKYVFFNFFLSVVIYLMYEYLKKHKVFRDLLVFCVVFNFIIAFYGIGLIMIE